MDMIVKGREELQKEIDAVDKSLNKLKGSFEEQVDGKIEPLEKDVEKVISLNAEIYEILENHGEMIEKHLPDVDSDGERPVVMKPDSKRRSEMLRILI